MAVFERDRSFLAPPDLLTLSRIPLAGLFWVNPASPAWALSILAIAALTDVLDGMVARRMRRSRGMDPDAAHAGDWLDPLADKLFAASVLVAVAVEIRPDVLVLIGIGLREILLALVLTIHRAVRVLRQGVALRVRAGRLGKLTTVAQFLAVGAVVLRSPLQVPLAATAAVFGVMAVAEYTVRRITLSRREAQKRSVRTTGREATQER